MTDNGATAAATPETPEWYEWPTLTEAEVLTGVNYKTIKRAGEQGRIRRVKDRNERWRYNPEDLEELEPGKYGRRPNPRPYANGNGDAAETKEGSKTTPGAEVIEESFKGGTSLLKQAHGHVEAQNKQFISMMEVVQNLVKNVTQPLLEENKDIRAQNSKLQSGYWEAINAREAAMNEQHERDMEMAQQNAADARKNRMAKVFEDKAPQLLDKLLG
ncbi:MAG TPA: hypothetical protein VF420_13425, partial [Casimicrobiaceae bacterium]